MRISLRNCKLIGWAFLAIALVGSNTTWHMRFTRERETRDVFQRALANQIGLTGYAPILIVSRRNYRERDIYQFSKQDYNGDNPLTTKLKYPCLWADRKKFYPTSAPLSRISRLQSATVDLLLLECRLLGEDTDSLSRALQAVLSKYSEPHPEEKANTPEDIWRDISKMLSFPCRVDRALYDGTPCWIITCTGLPQPDTNDSDFSIPVSLDGRILTPAWREKGE